MTTFYLGTHRPHWLALVDVPLVVSRSTLLRRGRTPRDAYHQARCRWGLDSGGFTELNRPPHQWTMTAPEWASLGRLLHDEIGGVDWIAPQDWMCEPTVLALTGLTVREHQQRTVANYLDLCSLDADLPWMPVLQGWEPDDYQRCIELYANHGVDLAAQPLVGLGTVCRRQATREIGLLVASLARHHLPLHGFGVKIAGLRRYGHMLASSDSMAWSFDGRSPNGGRCSKHGAVRDLARLLGVDLPGSSCANCRDYALWWREHKAIPALGLWGVG